MIAPTRWPHGLYGLPPKIGAIKDMNKFDNQFFNIPNDKVCRFDLLNCCTVNIGHLNQQNISLTQFDKRIKSVNI